MKGWVYVVVVTLVAAAGGCNGRLQDPATDSGGTSPSGGSSVGASGAGASAGIGGASGMGASGMGAIAGGAGGCAAKPVSVAGPSKLNGSLVGLVDDADGWTAVWTRSTQLAVNETGGLFAARVGTDQVVRLANDDSAGVVAATHTPRGTLVCWAPYWSATQIVTHCAVLDASLSIVAQPTPSLPAAIAEFALMGNQLYAISGGTYAAPVITRVSEDLAATGPDVTLPSLPVAWNARTLVVLVPTSPDCGTQWEPAGCQLLFRALTPSGVVAIADVPVAPIAYSSTYDVRVAARDDGFLVTWNADDGLHVRHVDNTGVVVDSAVVPKGPEQAHYGQLLAIPEGYVAIGRGTYTQNTDYMLPRIVAFAPDGSLLQQARWLDLPPTGHSVPAELVATGRDRWGVEWFSEECCNDRFSSQLLFRTPCGPPFGEVDPPSNCRPDTSAAPLANQPFAGAFFHTSAPGDSAWVGIELSKQGSGCNICGESLDIPITAPLPICPPATIEWDSNKGVFGPDVGWCSSPGMPCMIALAGKIQITAYDEKTRAAGSYSFDFGGQTLSGTFDAQHCSKYTVCNGP